MIGGVPFPWYGGKRKWADIVWNRLGDPEVYVEPFAGSAAILFRRPKMTNAKREAIIDLCGFIANFWRAVKHAPDKVAEHMEWPLSHVDQLARHRWLNEWGKDSLAYLMDDPHWYDAKAAGWWCWGINIWLGEGWTSRREPLRNLKRPLMSSSLLQPFGLNDKTDRAHIYTYFHKLQERLRDVQVLCSNWKHFVCRPVLGDAPSSSVTRTVGIVLDPPYKRDQRKNVIYSNENQSNIAAQESYEWAVRHGDKYRICYFAIEGDFPVPEDWDSVTKKFPSNTTDTLDIAMFSPACIERQTSLF